MDVPYGLTLDFTSCMTCEYDGGCRYTDSGPHSWENGKAGWPGFVTDYTGHLICGLWTMALWLLLYIASRIPWKIQRIYHQCSKHSYHHSRKDRLVILSSDLKTWIRPWPPNLRYPLICDTLLPCPSPFQLLCLASIVRLKAFDPGFAYLVMSPNSNLWIRVLRFPHIPAPLWEICIRLENTHIHKF